MTIVKTVNVKNMVEGLDYEITHFDWHEPYQEVITREFNDKNHLKKMRLDEYYELWAQKFNAEQGVDTHVVASKATEKKGVYSVTVIKLKG